MINGKQSLSKTVLRDEFQNYNGFEMDYCYISLGQINWYLKNGLPVVVLRSPNSQEPDEFANVILTPQEFLDVRNGLLAQRQAIKRALELN